MKLKTLYKIDTKGKLRTWQISVKNNGDSSDIITIAGIEDGQKVTNTITITEGKNLGKINETNHYSQAILEMEAKWTLKMRGEYTDDLNNVRQAVLGSGIQPPMLAKVYDPTGVIKNSKTLEGWGILNDLIIIESKLDGNRVEIKVNKDSVTLYTRKGDKMFPIPHIEQSIRESYDKNFFNSEEITLDGELYTDTFSFNFLNGLLKKEDKSPEQLELLKEVKFHIYDTYSDEFYEKRFEMIQKFVSDSVILIEAHKIVATDENIRKYHEEFLSKGYEGSILRRLDMPYEHKRSKSLLKYKDFSDDEYELIDIEEDARGGNLIGAFVMKLSKPSKDRDGKELLTFNAGVSGMSQAEQKEFTLNKEKYIGKMATVRFFGLSEYSLPRFPKFKGIRYD